MSKLALPESLSDAWDILTSESRSELMLTASYKPRSKSIVIRLGNFKRLEVPVYWIEQKYPNADIDPTQLSIRGLGQLLYLGECEVDLDSILRAFK